MQNDLLARLYLRTATVVCRWQRIALTLKHIQNHVAIRRSFDAAAAKYKRMHSLDQQAEETNR